MVVIKAIQAILIVVGKVRPPVSAQIIPVIAADLVVRKHRFRIFEVRCLQKCQHKRGQVGSIGGMQIAAQSL